MNKIRLELDALVVESFHTGPSLPLRGTVAAAQESGDSGCANCASAEPCTGIPIETCTCGCGPVTVDPSPSPSPQPVPPSACYATSPCTCIPIETCSCGVEGWV